MNKTTTNKNLATYSLENIIEKKFRIDEPDRSLVEKWDLNKLEVNVKFGMARDMPENLLKCLFIVTYSYVEGSPKKELLYAELTIEFKIIELKKHIQNIDDDTFRLPPGLSERIVSEAYTFLRGYLTAKLRGSFLRDCILPPIYPQKLIDSATKSQTFYQLSEYE